ncbi:MAG: FG-GAP-like repeat-containing protein [Phycisphaerales bacterium]
MSALLPSSGGDGTLGYVLEGIEPGDRSGFSVAAAGDVNGDGIDDFLIGAPRASGLRHAAGEAFLVFGAVESSGPVLQLADLDGRNGVRFLGGTQYSADEAGYAVSGVGDVNGDGLDDFAIGSPWAYGSYPDRTPVGYAHVIFGRDGAYPADERLNYPTLAQARVRGWSASGQLGADLAAAGDFNGDGFQDVLVGHKFGDEYPDVYSGRAYVVFGGPGLPRDFHVHDLPVSVGVTIRGDEGDRAGTTVRWGGDFNGDGMDEIIVAGDTRIWPTKRNARAYVIYGRGSAHPTAIELADLGFGAGFRLDNASSQGAAPIAAAGDLNGDGFDDLVLGQPFVDVDGVKGAGQVLVLFGRPWALPSFFDLDVRLDVLGGFRVIGSSEDEWLGHLVSPAGDVNGDGVDDLLIANAVRGVESRSVYVLFGARDGFPDAIRSDEIAARFGVAITPEAGIRPSTLAGVGDANGDGVDDIAIGAHWDLDATGRTFLLFGRHAAAECPADLDGDGELTIFDFLEFQNLFDAGDPRADFDGDGSLTIFDFLAFQNAFDAGCP